MHMKLLCSGLLAAALAGGGAQAAPSLCDGAANDLAQNTAIPSRDDPLTLSAALLAVQTAAPELRAAALEALAQRADARQAGLRPNPVLGIEVEDFDGAGIQTLGAGESTASVSQTFMLGGKRRKAEVAGLARARASEAYCARQMRDLTLQAADYFYALVAAEERARLAQQAALLAAEVSDAVQRRVEAGAAASVEAIRAEADSARARAEAAAVAADVARLRLSLAALWGAENAPFGEAVSDAAEQALPQPGEVMERAETHPRLRASRLGLDARRRELTYQRSLAMPDVTARLGVKSFRDTDEQALVAGISLPLPIFDRNQGAVEAASRRAVRADLEARAVRNRLASEIRRAHAEAVAAQARESALTDEAVPAAREAFEAARIGYRAGKFDLTALLDARRSLVEIETTRVEAARAARSARAELLSLGGYPPYAPIQITGYDQ